MPDWTTIDTSRIPEVDFPIRCDRCGNELKGLGEAGRCPECDLPFSRRLRLWQTYGPEAFADPPITPAEQEPPEPNRVFLSGLWAALATTLCLSLALLAWRAVLGPVEWLYWLFAWAVITTAVVWLAVVRRIRRIRRNDRNTDTNAA